MKQIPHEYHKDWEGLIAGEPSIAWKIFEFLDARFGRLKLIEADKEQIMSIYKYDFASQLGLISKNINILDSMLLSEKPSPGVKNLYNLGLVQRFLEMETIFDGIDPESLN